MYSLFSKLSGYVLGSEEEHESTSHKLPDSPAKQPHEKEAPVVEKEDAILRKTFYGKVTRLYDGAGVIDGEVYFTFDVCVGGFRPEMGCEVHVDAARENATSGWKATRVNCVQEWDTPGESGTIETVIGMATSINGDTLELNNELTFNMPVLRHQSYSPCKGDWVKIDIERFGDDSFEIRGVQPLREKSFSGTVNSVFPGYGYIDEEVYFSIGACVRGYRPCRGDHVQVTAIESMQGKCKWRAIHVKLNRNISRQSSTDVGNLQQFLGNKMTQLLSDKDGLAIHGILDFGDVSMGETRETSLGVKNTSDKNHTFKSCSFVRADPQFEIHFMDDTANQQCRELTHSNTRQGLCPGVKIAPQETKHLSIRFIAKSLGRVKQLVVLTFEGCEIGRHVTSNVVDQHQALLAPVTPYQQNRVGGRGAWDRFMESNSKERWIIPGERPTRKNKIIFPIKLKMYNIPSDIRQCIIEQGDLTARVPALHEPLSMRTHNARFRVLLSAEELQMEIDMREFDLQNVTMDLYKEFLSLHVPGLAEGRPSLLLGDTVVVALSDDSSDAPKYQGYIHEVRKDDVLLKFNEDFHKNFGLQDCDVTFFFNRSNIRRSQQAVEFAAQLGPEVMFPRTLESKLPVVSLCFGSMGDQHSQDGQTSESTEVDFLYNNNLNDRQQAAVSRILSGQCRPTPYVLFGPPGTGKTVTLVEAILQVFHRVPSSRIIACAPSNSAADLLAIRLHRSSFVQEGDMVRLNAFQRGQEIAEEIIPYCLDTDSLNLAAHFRIIVSTCSTSGQLFSLGLRVGHFTHVFVDEAGQATEPECLIPMGLAAGGDGQIILAGDPHQLGPVLRSSLAIEYGLNISLLERLMSRPLYARDEARFLDHGCYDPLLVTKLVNNYRSHPSLLHLPSAVFYHSELKVHADRTMRERFSQFKMLPQKGVPLVFHGVKGEDVREGNSPSWFNPAEAVQIVRYVQGLKNSQTYSIKLNDIGIISPYKKQVEKIRLLLRQVRIDNIKVGSVEEFQGQERPVIIISTVRSGKSHVSSDVSHSVGFLSNPKRFNVAITRAQSLLIVIGNPHVLCRDPYWCSLVHYCVMNDVYTGCDLPDLPDLDNDLYQEEFQYAIDVLSRIVTDNDTTTHSPDKDMQSREDGSILSSGDPTSTSKGTPQPSNNKELDNQNDAQIMTARGQDNMTYTTDKKIIENNIASVELENSSVTETATPLDCPRVSRREEGVVRCSSQQQNGEEKVQDLSSVKSLAYDNAVGVLDNDGKASKCHGFFEARSEDRSQNFTEEDQRRNSSKIKLHSKKSSRNKLGDKEKEPKNSKNSKKNLKKKNRELDDTSSVPSADNLIKMPIAVKAASKECLNDLSNSPAELENKRTQGDQGVSHSETPVARAPEELKTNHQLESTNENRSDRQVDDLSDDEELEEFLFKPTGH